MVDAATQGCESKSVPDIAACLRKGEAVTPFMSSRSGYDKHWGCMQACHLHACAGSCKEKHTTESLLCTCSGRILHARWSS